MVIRLGYFKYGETQIGKTFHQIDDDFSVIIKENTSENEPTFVVIGKPLDFFSDINAVYVPLTGRYYNINDKEIDTGNRVNLVCEVDALFTFKEDILRSEQLIARNENLVDNEIRDDLFPLYAKETISCKTVGTIPDGYGVVLLTTGTSGEGATS